MRLAVGKRLEILKKIRKSLIKFWRKRWMWILIWIHLENIKSGKNLLIKMVSLLVSAWIVHGLILRLGQARRELAGW